MAYASELSFTFIGLIIRISCNDANLSEVVTVDLLAGLGICQCPLAAGTYKLTLANGCFQIPDALSDVALILPVGILIAQRIEGETVGTEGRNRTSL